MRHAVIAGVIVVLLAAAAGGLHLWRVRAAAQAPAAALPPLAVEARASRFGDYWAEVFVVDLGEPGIRLLAPRATGATFFDMDNDGFAELTGWVAPDDGLLAIDLDGDQRITSYSELLGGGDRSGFSALNWLDSDRNGTIDQFDRDYERLYVWRDVNGDGLSSPNELIPLGRSTIRIIPLRGRAVEQTNGQQAVVARGPVYISGTERDMIAARLGYDNTVSRDDRPLGRFDPAVLALPDLRGYGRLTSLRRAMNGDQVLRDMVSAFKDTPISDLLSTSPPVEETTRAILYRWARVDALPDDGRGMADSRRLEWLEEYRDEEYRQGGPMGVANPTPDMQPYIAATFARPYAMMTGRLLAQSQLGALFSGLRYNAQRDVLEGYRGLDPQRLAQVRWIAGQSRNPQAAWRAVMLLVYALGEQAISSADCALLVAAIAATAPGTSYDALLSDIRARESVTVLPAAGGAVSSSVGMVTAPVSVDAAVRASGGTPNGAAGGATGGDGTVKIRRVGGTGTAP